MQKKIEVPVHDTTIELILTPKRESKLHRLISKLPFIPRSYLDRYWTTIGRHVAVSNNAADQPDFGEPSWVERVGVILRHEARHAYRAEKLTLPVYATGYLGPSVTLGIPALIVSAIAGIWVGWEPLQWAAIVTAALLPLSTGFAAFRAWDEWDAYEEAVITQGAARVESVARTLWLNYALTIPPFVTRWWYRRKLGDLVAPR